jgi:hypothetical protein
MAFDSQTVRVWHQFVHKLKALLLLKALQLVLKSFIVINMRQKDDPSLVI